MRNYSCHTVNSIINPFEKKCELSLSVSARPEFFGVIDDPMFENLGVIGKFRGSELFNV